MLVLGVFLMLATPAHAVLSIVPEPRTELLYTTKDIDCTMLHTMDSTQLPQNVVRLRAQMDGADIDPNAVRVQWSFKGAAAGMLAADLDFGPTGQLPTVTSMCADFGNQCLLSGDRLATYDEPTIFYVAPTCSSLGRDPTKPFVGGSVKIRVRAFSGKKKLGKADATIGFGRNGGATLFVENVSDEFVDGIGKQAGVTTFVITDYAARIQQPRVSRAAGVPGRGDLGSPLTPGPCSMFPADACGGQQSGGQGTMLLTATFEDDSALCDNIKVVIATCSPDGNLEVIPKPKRTTYDPANPSQNLVDVTVRLHNTSKPQGGLPACPFFLRGNIATCSSTLKVADFTDTKSASFALPHCSTTTDTTCTRDADCAAGERCLDAPYCSSTVDRDCTRDADCTAPACPNCQPEEICVRMLDFPSNGTEIVILPGKSFDVVTGKALLRNHFKTTAAMTDLWTVNVRIPSLTFTKSLKYKIRGRP
jgi:hypothetical protein